MLKRCDGFQIEVHFALAVIWRTGLCCGGYRQQVGKTFQKSHRVCTLTQMTDVYQSLTCVSRLCWTWAGRNHTEWGHCSSAREDTTVYGVRKIIKQSTTKVLVCCLNDLFMYLFIQQFFLCQAVFKALGKGSSCSGKTHIMLMLAFGLVLGSSKEKLNHH